MEADLPVGRNLQDHVTTMLGPFVLDKPWSFLPTRLLRYNLRLIGQRFYEKPEYLGPKILPLNCLRSMASKPIDQPFRSLSSLVSSKRLEAPQLYSWSAI